MPFFESTGILRGASSKFADANTKFLFDAASTVFIIDGTVLIIGRRTRFVAARPEVCDTRTVLHGARLSGWIFINLVDGTIAGTGGITSARRWITNAGTRRVTDARRAVGLDAFFHTTIVADARTNFSTNLTDFDFVDESFSECRFHPFSKRFTKECWLKQQPETKSTIYSGESGKTTRSNYSTRRVLRGFAPIPSIRPRFFKTKQRGQSGIGEVDGVAQEF